ncbi:MAG: CRTAC1 family protein [Bryobacteraceae bacterium]|nr:CRTAC1 family protein [Bryobacteraceae bacterium]
MRLGLRFAVCVVLPACAASLPMSLFTGETARKPLPATMPGGIAVFDADNDGLLDIFFANGAPLPAGRKTSPLHSNRFFRNRGAMRFEDRTAAAGLAGVGYDFAAAAGDFDRDGHIDLLVSGLRGLTLYRNRGQGIFEDVTARSGLDNLGRWSVGAAWLDIDNDGDLDLFVVNYVRWDAATEKACVVEGRPDFCHPRFYEPQPNALFRNDGGRFTDISVESGIAQHAGKGMAAAVADFDLDGRPDIFVTNDRAFNFLFHNLGNGRFSEIAFESGVAVPASGNPPSAMGTDAQDYDNDGRPDLVYTALRDETFPLYRNAGAEFTDATMTSGLSTLTRAMAGWSIVFADLDNDGRKDLAIARGEVLSATGAKGATGREPLTWLRNTGARFEAGAPIAAPPQLYRGLVAADLDNDGCLDLVATALQAAPQVIKRACPPGSHWLKVIAPPGARVSVDGQWRHVTYTSGYASSCHCPLHFGVGAGPVRVKTGEKDMTVKVDQVIQP